MDTLIEYAKLTRPASAFGSASGYTRAFAPVQYRRRLLVLILY